MIRSRWCQAFADRAELPGVGGLDLGQEEMLNRAVHLDDLVQIAEQIVQYEERVERVQQPLPGLVEQNRVRLLDEHIVQHEKVLEDEGDQDERQKEEERKQIRLDREVLIDQRHFGRFEFAEFDDRKATEQLRSLDSKESRAICSSVSRRFANWHDS